jgi:hypothetical protein
MTRPNWHQSEVRPETWQHDTLPVWCVYFSATHARAEYWQAYKTKDKPKKGIALWGNDNVRIGSEAVGFASLEQAQEVAEIQFQPIQESLI